jgi:hypothetical protein
MGVLQRTPQSDVLDAPASATLCCSNPARKGAMAAVEASATDPQQSHIRNAANASLSWLWRRQRLEDPGGAAAESSQGSVRAVGMQSDQAALIKSAQDACKTG